MTVPQVWAGVDAAKTHHHCVVMDTDGGRLLSRRVLNDEEELLGLIADVLTLAAAQPVTGRWIWPTAEPRC